MRRRVTEIMFRIAAADLEGLDVKKLQGDKWKYRCRVGNVRILFVKGPDGKNFILDADFRGNIYK